MIKRRTSVHIRLLVAAILIAASHVAMGQVPARAALTEDTVPADCLVMATVPEPMGFANDLAGLLSALGGDVSPDKVLAQLGQRFGNPTMCGIDVSAPVNIFFMDSKKYVQPWVCQFALCDADKFARLVAQDEFRLYGSVATWAADAVARDVVAEWEQNVGSSFSLRSSGQVIFRADVARLMRVYDDEITRQVLMMKNRMRRALERPEVTFGREEAIVAAQAEMNRLLSILAQVENVELSAEITARSVLFGFDVMPKQDTTLASFIKSHPKGSLGILSRCPGDAMAVVMHNLSIRRAMERMLSRFLGMANVLNGIESGSAAEGQSLYAVLQSDVADDAIELLQVATGDAAIRTLTRWKRFSSQEPSVDALPLRLQLLEDASAAKAGVSLAEVISKESVSNRAFGHAIRWFFGDHPIAAQGVVAGHSIFMICESIAQVTKRIEKMRDTRFMSLLSEMSFVNSMTAVPDHPNVLFYVSPSGIRGWLSLAGVELDAYSAESLGVCAGVALREDGRVLGSFEMPREPVQQAIRLQGHAVGVTSQDPLNAN